MSFKMINYIYIDIKSCILGISSLINNFEPLHQFETVKHFFYHEMRIYGNKKTHV